MHRLAAALVRYASFAGLVPGTMAAQQESASLRNLTAVTVEVTILTDLPRPPLNSADVRTELELRLRRMGIDVVSGQRASSTVALTLTAAGTGSNVATAIGSKLQVLQLARIVGGDVPPGFYVTWATDRVAISGGATTSATSKTLIARLLDDFENAWREANVGR